MFYLNEITQFLKFTGGEFTQTVELTVVKSTLVLSIERIIIESYK